jgi:DNA-binding HxlR family transcriptional regulator
LLEDYAVILAIVVITAGVVILGFFMARYRQLVSEVGESTLLAKDVWSSMQSRFMVTDSRVIDLMAKVEVLSERLKSPQKEEKAPAVVPTEPGITTPPRAAVSSQLEVGGGDTERKILESLAAGPKTSGQIREVIGRSREHTARLLKTLFEKELVVRNDANKPYVYEITGKGRDYLGN